MARRRRYRRHLPNRRGSSFPWTGLIMLGGIAGVGFMLYEFGSQLMDSLSSVGQSIENAPSEALSTVETGVGNLVTSAENEASQLWSSFTNAI